MLGRQGAAAEAIARAVELNDGDYGALSTTRRQLRLVCEATGVDAACWPRSPVRPSRTFVATAWGRRRRGALSRGGRGRGRGGARRGARPRADRLRLRRAGRRRRHPVGRGPAGAWGRAPRGAARLAQGVRARVGRARGPGLGGPLPTGASTRRRPSSTRQTTPSGATTCCSATRGPSWRWTRRCSVRAFSMRRPASSRCGIEAAPTAGPGRRSTSRPGGAAGDSRWPSTRPGGAGSWTATRPRLRGRCPQSRLRSASSARCCSRTCAGSRSSPTSSTCSSTRPSRQRSRGCSARRAAWPP